MRPSLGQRTLESFIVDPCSCQGSTAFEHAVPDVFKSMDHLRNRVQQQRYGSQVCPSTRLVRMENVFDGVAKQGGNPKGQRQARIILFVFQRINCLSRYAETFAELGLGPAPVRPQFPQSVFHAYLTDAMASPMPHRTIINGGTNIMRT